MHDPTRHSTERVSRGRFDLIATFAQETQARQALADLRTAGFGPNEALLLQPERNAPNLLAPAGQIILPSAELAADRTAAIWIIVCTEFAVGALAGALVGWIIALFLNAPNIGPVWGWMLGLGALGAVAGIALGALEWRNWKHETDRLQQQVAIGLRFAGRNPANDLARARSILAQHGGSGTDNA